MLNYCDFIVAPRCWRSVNLIKMLIRNCVVQSWSHHGRLDVCKWGLLFPPHVWLTGGLVLISSASGAPARSGQPKPPSSLSANQSSAGVILQWSPPEAQHPPVTAFVLQSRAEQGEWVNLDETIGANRSEIVVPGLHKVKSDAQRSLWDESVYAPSALEIFFFFFLNLGCISAVSCAEPPQLCTPSLFPSSSNPQPACPDFASSSSLFFFFF